MGNAFGNVGTSREHVGNILRIREKSHPKKKNSPFRTPEKEKSGPITRAC